MTLQWSLLLLAGLIGWSDEADAKEGEAPEAVASLLADVPKTLPAMPQVRNFPGCLVFHGDLFGDGRHLAIVAKGDETAVAEVNKTEWREIARWPVAAAWVADGERAQDKGYSRINPPACPFILKNLDGDRIPELLIAFDDDGYQLGYRIVKKRQNATDLELLIVSSTGEPSCRDGYLITHEATGRKAWGGGDLYFRWVEGTPVFTAESYENCSDPDRLRAFYTRVLADKSEETFCARFDDGWRISRVESRVEPRNEKPFVSVHFVARNPGVEWSHEAEEAFLFQKLTSLDWKLRIPGADETPQDQLGSEFAKFNVEVRGEPEAIKAFSAMPSPGP